MIKDNPVTGYGSGGFLANYMNYQAEYFARDTDSKYAILAGDVKHPFNEYILLVVNYGLIGFLLFLAFVFCGNVIDVILVSKLILQSFA